MSHEEFFLNDADKAIHAAIQAKFDQQPKLDVSKIQTFVRDGEVTLKGEADTEEEKKLALSLATETEGVTGVKDHLHVSIGIAHALSSFASKLTSDKPEMPE